MSLNMVDENTELGQIDEEFRPAGLVDFTAAAAAIPAAARRQSLAALQGKGLAKNRINMFEVTHKSQVIHSQRQDQSSTVPGSQAGNAAATVEGAISSRRHPLKLARGTATAGIVLDESEGSDDETELQDGFADSEQGHPPEPAVPAGYSGDQEVLTVVAEDQEREQTVGQAQDAAAEVPSTVMAGGAEAHGQEQAVQEHPTGEEAEAMDIDEDYDVPASTTAPAAEGVHDQSEHGHKPLPQQDATAAATAAATIAAVVASTAAALQEGTAEGSADAAFHTAALVAGPAEDAGGAAQPKCCVASAEDEAPGQDSTVAADNTAADLSDVVQVSHGATHKDTCAVPETCATPSQVLVAKHTGTAEYNQVHVATGQLGLADATPTEHVAGEQDAVAGDVHYLAGEWDAMDVDDVGVAPATTVAADVVSPATVAREGGGRSELAAGASAGADEAHVTPAEAAGLGSHALGQTEGTAEPAAAPEQPVGAQSEPVEGSSIIDSHTGAASEQCEQVDISFSPSVAGDVAAPAARTVQADQQPKHEAGQMDAAIAEEGEVVAGGNALSTADAPLATAEVNGSGAVAASNAAPQCLQDAAQLELGPEVEPARSAAMAGAQMLLELEDLSMPPSSSETTSSLAQAQPDDTDSQGVAVLQAAAALEEVHEQVAPAALDTVDIDEAPEAAAFKEATPALDMHTVCITDTAVELNKPALLDVATLPEQDSEEFGSPIVVDSPDLAAAVPASTDAIPVPRASPPRLADSPTALPCGLLGDADGDFADEVMGIRISQSFMLTPSAARTVTREPAADGSPAATAPGSLQTRQHPEALTSPHAQPERSHDAQQQVQEELELTADLVQEPVLPVTAVRGGVDTAPFSALTVDVSTPVGGLTAGGALGRKGSSDNDEGDGSCWDSVMRAQASPVSQGPKSTKTASRTGTRTTTPAVARATRTTAAPSAGKRSNIPSTRAAPVVKVISQPAAPGSTVSRTRSLDDKDSGRDADKPQPVGLTPKQADSNKGAPQSTLRRTASGTRTPATAAKAGGPQGAPATLGRPPTRPRGAAAATPAGGAKLTRAALGAGMDTPLNAKASLPVGKLPRLSMSPSVMLGQDMSLDDNGSADWLHKSVEFEGLTPGATPAAGREAPLSPVAQGPAALPGHHDERMAAELAAEAAARQALEQELKAFKAMYDKQKDAHMDAEVKLRSQMAVMDAELSKLRDQKENAEQVYNDVYSNKYRPLKDQAAELQTALSKATKDKMATDLQLRKLRLDTNAAQAKQQELESQLQQIQAALEVSQAEVQELRAKLAKTRDHKELQQQVQALEQDLEAARLKLEVQQKHHEKLLSESLDKEDRLTTLDMKYQDVKKRFAKLHGDHKDLLLQQEKQHAELSRLRHEKAEWDVEREQLLKMCDEFMQQAEAKAGLR